MTDRAHSPKIESHDIPEAKPAAKPNPFKIGESVRLRDGTAANGTVSGIMGNQVCVAWDSGSGDPQWYHQDFVATARRPSERDRTPLPKTESDAKPDGKPNPFKIGECVRLRDGTFTNGIVKGLLVDQVLVAWRNVSSDPQWYHQDFISTETKFPERGSVPEENQVEQDIVVDDACRLVARMDDGQRARFIAYIQETYK